MNLSASKQVSITLLSRKHIAILTLATGIAVANLYYSQPLLDQFRSYFGVGPGPAGLIVTATQVGYCLGLLLLLPLGDILERRNLVAFLSGICALLLIAASQTHQFTAFIAENAVTGFLSVVAQILVPFAASFTSFEKRGRVVGTVMSGLLVGVLLARVFSGYVAFALGWQWVYIIAGILMAALAAILRLFLPSYRERGLIAYHTLVVSLLDLYRREPVLRWRSLFGALAFAEFSVLWTSLAFLLSGPPYHYSTGIIGLFGLAGAVGATTASVAGRLSDKGFARPTTTLASFGLLIAYVFTLVGRYYLTALIAGILILDFAVQGIHISNQSIIYRLKNHSHSRINSIYMTMYFLGGVFGSTVSAFVYQFFGWVGVCASGIAIAAITLTLIIASGNASYANSGGRLVLPQSENTKD